MPNSTRRPSRSVERIEWRSKSRSRSMGEGPRSKMPRVDKQKLWTASEQECLDEITMGPLKQQLKILLVMGPGPQHIALWYCSLTSGLRASSRSLAIGPKATLCTLVDVDDQLYFFVPNYDTIDFVLSTFGGLHGILYVHNLYEPVSRVMIKNSSGSSSLQAVNSGEKGELEILEALGGPKIKEILTFLTTGWDRAGNDMIDTEERENDLISGSWGDYGIDRSGGARYVQLDHDPGRFEPGTAKDKVAFERGVFERYRSSHLQPMIMPSSRRLPSSGASISSSGSGGGSPFRQTLIKPARGQLRDDRGRGSPPSWEDIEDRLYRLEEENRMLRTTMEMNLETVVDQLVARKLDQMGFDPSKVDDGMPKPPSKREIKKNTAKAVTNGAIVTAWAYARGGEKKLENAMWEGSKFLAMYSAGELLEQSHRQKATEEITAKKNLDKQIEKAARFRD